MRARSSNYTVVRHNKFQTQWIDNGYKQWESFILLLLLLRKGIKITKTNPFQLLIKIERVSIWLFLLHVNTMYWYHFINGQRIFMFWNKLLVASPTWILKCFKSMFEWWELFFSILKNCLTACSSEFNSNALTLKCYCEF